MSTSQVLDALYQTIESRRGQSPESSYTAKLFSQGRAKIAQKVGEEAVEAVIAAVGGDKEELAAESADLLYHLLVLWADSGVEPSEVYRILAERQGLSGLDEKAARVEKLSD